ncbi:MFS transporter, AAHS family, benzoate transport protein [Cryobacterium psychrotolerans]|uniref:MFS transporter, AAHS family, benzoate transport protein n=1 Tax=Cryobacterium psychrotolerans TaxID=386301 RepID=A0A1G9BAN6_9MICO|nr:aromatic acid/H+ symport family MFS transporter [Cryobacterium psychrotolerans]TFD84677.1 MFS transporter [Cryobacterium psychrotolerans]SDK36130.1 MFS transporter, AAHS family, benzoate transport protein [Cryobacterium psychrotolerans]
MTQSHATPAATKALPKRSGGLVLALCFFTIVFDGYDLVVFGATVPTLLAHPTWNIDPAQAGLIGSLALIGMLIGTLTVGALTDVLGRRKIMLFCIAWFSVCMLATAAAPNETVFAVLRFLTGLGLGGVVPTCIALTVEYAPKTRRQIANALMFSGYSVGGVAAAVLAMSTLPALDFRWLYAIGALPLVTLLPIAYKYLPESIAFLANRRSPAEARATADRFGLVYADIVTDAPAVDARAGASAAAVPARQSSLKDLFSARWRRSTILFAAANFCGLLLVYGLNTWLPQIMRGAGFELGHALAFLLVLNLGAIVGSIGASWVADRIGIKKVVTASFILACISIFLISLNLPVALLFVLVAFAGLGSVGTQILVGGFCATHYPQRLSPTALGWSLGVGRIGAMMGPIIGGVIASTALGYQANFYVFAAVAVLGAIVVSSVSTRTGESQKGAAAVETAPAQASV